MKNSMLDRAFKSWPRYSGSLAHPVPSATDNYTPSYMFESAKLWDNNQYGDYRRELAAHCVVRFTATLDRINQRIASYENQY